MPRFISSAGQELPAEFSPPERAADHIAEMKALADREAYWLRIPECWRPMIAQFAVIAIASRIVEMPEKFDRQNAIASVPEFLRERVKAFVLTMWQTRELRAQYQAELRARRDRESRHAA
jgi:hypothetical protein